MPIYMLPDEPVFPNPNWADESGVLAIGGDLARERLIAAYRQGIFPWPYEDETLLWWCPDPRTILVPSEVQVSRSLRAVIRRAEFDVRMDQDFRGVMIGCASTPRPGQESGSWINDEMVQAYVDLFEQGLAHSIESYHQGELVGGLYGVCLGRVFFGESMFSRRDNASKVALVALCRLLQENRFEFIDCQLRTDHLIRMGAREIPRSEFLTRLRRATTAPWDRSRWEPIPF